MSDRRKPLYVSLTSKIGGFYGGDRNALETKVNYRHWVMRSPQH